MKFLRRILGILALGGVYLVGVSQDVIAEFASDFWRENFGEPAEMEIQATVFSERDSALLELQTRGYVYRSETWVAAFSENDHELIELLVRLKLPIEKRYYDDLWVTAFRHNDKYLIDFLVQRKIPIPEEAHSALWSQAAQKRDPFLVDLLLDRKIPTNDQVYQDLWRSAFIASDKNFIDFLVARKIRIVEEGYITLWHLASEKRDTYLIGFLLSKKIPIDEQILPELWVNAVQHFDNNLLDFLSEKEIVRPETALCDFSANEHLKFIVENNMYYDTRCTISLGGTLVDNIIYKAGFAKPPQIIGYHPDWAVGKKEFQETATDPAWVANIPYYASIPNAIVTSKSFLHQSRSDLGELNDIIQDRSRFAKRGFDFCMANVRSETKNLLPQSDSITIPESWKNVAKFEGVNFVHYGYGNSKYRYSARICPEAREVEIIKSCSQLCKYPSGRSPFSRDVSVPPYCWKTHYDDGGVLMRCFFDETLRPEFSGKKMTTKGDFYWHECNPNSNETRQKTCEKQKAHFLAKLAVIDLYYEYLSRMEEYIEQIAGD